MIATSANAARLSPWWRHSAILVMIAGFSVLTFVTVLTYTNAPPIPERVTDVMGTVLFTGADIQMGQEVFLKYGLMEHGSLWGHGAYLGPDYSAEYLHRLSEVTLDTIANEKYGKPFAQLSPDERSIASARTMTALKENRYEPTSRTLRFSPGEVAAYRTQLPEWSDYFTRKDAAPGLPANYIQDPAEQKALTAYFAWAAWAAAANRPGKDYSYTNNWPYEPIAGNRPSTEAYVWSALSLITLLSGLGLILFVVGKFDYLGWKGEGASAHIMHSAPLALKLTPSQWATGWYFAVVALLFLAQSFLGGVLAHYLWRREPFTGSTSPAGCPTPWRAPGTYNSPFSGSRRHGWAAAFSWRRGSVARSPNTSEPASTHSSVRWWWSSLAAWQASPSALTTSWGSSGSGSVTRVPSIWTSGGSGSTCWPLASSSGCF
jgi:nitric oxide reductase subunit B